MDHLKKKHFAGYEQLFEFCILEVGDITTDFWTSSCMDAYMAFTNAILSIVLVLQAEEIDIWLDHIRSAEGNKLTFGSIPIKNLAKSDGYVWGGIKSGTNGWVHAGRDRLWVISGTRLFSESRSRVKMSRALDYRGCNISF